MEDAESNLRYNTGVRMRNRLTDMVTLMFFVTYCSGVMRFMLCTLPTSCNFMYQSPSSSGVRSMPFL